MKSVTKYKVVVPLMLAALLILTTSVFAAYSLFGDATIVQPGYNSNGAAQLVSDDNPAYGGIDFDVAAGTTFADLQLLSAAYNVTDDDCTNGSPRFQITVDQAGTEENIFVYFGPSPNYTGCAQNTWVESGDLLQSGLFVDTTQLGGTFYDPYDNALATYGGLLVTGVQLVVDAGYASGGEQTILVDNVIVNNDFYDFEDQTPITPTVTVTEPPITPTAVVTPGAELTKDDCKNGGWVNFPSPPGPFRNQGDCVSYFATGGRNTGNG